MWLLFPPKFSANFLQYCSLVLCDDEACVSMERKLLGREGPGSFKSLTVVAFIYLDRHRKIRMKQD